MALGKYTACFVLVYFSVTIVCLLTQTVGRVVPVTRQDCPDGTHQHNQITCCKCPRGQKIKEDCTDQTQTKCELCEAGKEYQSQANYLKTCEPCTSCSQPNANLEVDRPCTPYNNTVCKCKENHYCSSGTQPCTICEPCQQCGSKVVKEACSATTNTICKESNGNAMSIPLGILIPLVLLAVVGGVAFYLWKKKQRQRAESRTNATSNGREDPAEKQPFIGVNLQPHISEIANVIQWTDVRNLAMKSGMQNCIDNCVNDLPNDSLERTIKLLGMWVEKESKNASQKLIEYLQKNNQNVKAEKVKEILAEASKNSSNNSNVVGTTDGN